MVRIAGEDGKVQNIGRHLPVICWGSLTTIAPRSLEEIWPAQRRGRRAKAGRSMVTSKKPGRGTEVYGDGDAFTERLLHLVFVGSALFSHECSEFRHRVKLWERGMDHDL